MLERDRRGRPLPGRRRPTRATIRADVVVNAGGMYAPQIGADGRRRGADHPVRARVPRDRGVRSRRSAAADDARPRRLVYFRNEVGGLIMGGYERKPGTLGHSTASRRLRSQLLPEDWERFDELLTNSVERVPAWRRRGAKALQRPRGVHARRRVHPRRVGGAGVLGRGRVLRPRPRRRRRHGLAGGRVDRERRAEPRPVAHGLAPVRPPVPEPGLHARPDDRDLCDLLRHQVPQPRARGGPAAAALAGLRPRGRAGRRLRREVGVGAAELVRAERRAGRRGPAAARLGGPTLVAGDPRRVRRDPRAGGALRRELVRQDRGVGAGRRRLPPADVRERRRHAPSARSPTRRC